jgi:flagellar biosynthesis protein FlhB
MAGNMFSDETLFILLDVLRYSTYVVFICLVYKIVIGIYGIFSRLFGKKAENKEQKLNNKELKKAVIRAVIKIVLYFILLVYCFGIIYFEAFIIVFSEGSG